MSKRNHMEHVLLIPGLGHRAEEMAPIAYSLNRHGFTSEPLCFPSTKLSLERMVLELGRHVDAWHGVRRLHFVTHSMGGILLRILFAQRRLPANIGRTVMLAPPNHGSQVVDFLTAVWPLNWYYRHTRGAAGQRLGTGAHSVIHELPQEALFPVGIIAGNRPLRGFWGYVFSHFVLPRPNDGRVSVVSTRLKGMQGFLVLRTSHFSIMQHPEVADECAHFLMRGVFS